MEALRLIATAALVWFVFRWLDRVFGSASSRRRRPPSSSGRTRSAQGSRATMDVKPKDDGLGDYVDFEEIDEK